MMEQRREENFVSSLKCAVHGERVANNFTRYIMF